jgi:hypothetical protein
MRRYFYAGLTREGETVYVRAEGRDSLEACERALSYLQKRGFRVSYLTGCPRPPRRAEVLDAGGADGEG